MANGLQRSGRIITSPALLVMIVFLRTSPALLVMIVFLRFAAGQGLDIREPGRDRGTPLL